MNSSKKVPERMCVACRQMKPKFELMRIVKTPDGQILVDTTGKVNGRGVYICKCKQCLEKAYKNKNFSKMNGFSISEEMFAQLENIFE